MYGFFITLSFKIVGSFRIFAQLRFLNYTDDIWILYMSLLLSLIIFFNLFIQT